MVTSGVWQRNIALKPATVPGDPGQVGQSSWARYLVLIWLLGMLFLLPLDLIKLPFNVTLVDCWVFLATPLFWLAFRQGQYVISWSYVLPMWLILVASFASSFVAPAPLSSFIVIVKEIYAYIWFVTLAALLARLHDRDFRLVLLVWTGVVFFHGFVIVGQFLSPALWRFIADLAGSVKDYELYRPAGLFANANPAAFFQALGFVPLVLVSPSQKVGVIGGVFLFLTMVMTGSMGATIAFLTGLTVAVMAIFLIGRLALILKLFAQLALILVLAAGVLSLVVSHNERYQAHFERIFFGRAERSSEGRFDLWRRGLDAYLENDVFLWGVGPENFREVDAKMTDNQLHNDFIAFAVERGLLGSLGLVLFAAVAVIRAGRLLRIGSQQPDQSRLAVVVFLGAMIATLVESLTHQIFHFRTLWVVLAFQEAMFFQLVPPVVRARKVVKCQVN
ncbi:MAG: O-antigen ligase family protein [Caldilineaceae bacterium]